MLRKGLKNMTCLSSTLNSIEKVIKKNYLCITVEEIKRRVYSHENAFLRKTQWGNFSFPLTGNHHQTHQTPKISYNPPTKLLRRRRIERYDVLISHNTI